MHNFPIRYLLLALLLAGCGSRYAGNYSGTMSATINGNPYNGATKLTLEQKGNEITGTWTQDTDTGTVSGTANEARITNFNYVVPPGVSCDGSYSGELTSKDKNLSGTLRGTGTCGTVTFTLNVDKTN